MPVLHGFPYSNYYNIPKHALLYKGVEFDENLIYPNEEEYVKFSPARKTPSLTTDDGQHLSESSVLCEYIEEAYPQKPLFPSEIHARNKVRQIMRMAELYLELPYRKLIPYRFMRKDIPNAVLNEVHRTVDGGIQGLNALGSFDPWIIGSEFTMADIYLYYVLTVVDAGSPETGLDLNARIPGLAEWRKAFADSPISERVAADTEANRQGFYDYVKSAL